MTATQNDPICIAPTNLAAVAVPLAFIDARHRRLPDALTLPSYPVALATLGVATPFTHDGARHLINALYAAIAVLTMYIALALLSRGAIGSGDVKLSGILGLYLGWLGMRAAVAGPPAASHCRVSACARR
jgi:prepilin signal peptidase PulO-like enzyme (type II secretory pathway)